MISFDKLWITLKERQISQYKLIKDYKRYKNLEVSNFEKIRNNAVQVR